MQRFTWTLIISSLAAVAPGCSHGANFGALPSPPSANATLPQFRLRRPVRISEFADLPRYYTYYGPTGIALGSDGNLWVTDTIDQDFGENAVVGIAPSGQQAHLFYYQGVSSQGASFVDIASGPDGALWITDEYNEQIVRMTPQGKFTNYPLHNYTAPAKITAGPDKALWFTATPPGAGAIVRLTTDGHMKVFPLAHSPTDITTGPDGALWFTEQQASQIGRITTHGKVSEFSQGISSGPYSIAGGRDGALWFTEPALGIIGRITTAGKVTEFSKGITPTEQPNDIAEGPDGAMWFTEYEIYGQSYEVHASKIGRITMKGTIAEYSKNLDPQSAPTAMALGPDKKMWFVESNTDKTGRLRP